MSRKASPLVRSYAETRGWHVTSLYQTPLHATRRCAEPSDPWVAVLTDSPSALTATKALRAVADTADAAVLAAIPSDLLAAIRRCELAIDSLHGCLQK
jgi:hypothetical protein